MSVEARSERREFGDGVLARGAAAVYHVVVLELLLLLTAGPGLVLLALLIPDRSNLPLAALAMVPAGPAVAATVFAWRAVLRHGGLEPARHFWRGYRLNAAPVLRWWVPALAVLTVLAVDLAHLDAVAPPGALRLAFGAVLAAVTVGVAVTVLHALVLTALFDLRTRDLLRLAWRHAAGSPRVTLGAVSLAVLALGVVAVGSDWVLALTGSLFALLLLHNAAPMTADVEENHTA